VTLYIYEENYHFEGHVAGVIVDDKRAALFFQKGVSSKLEIPDDLVWHELELLEEHGNDVIIKAKNFAFYKEFFCIQKRRLEA